jgi:hypothetical protein
MSLISLVPSPAKDERNPEVLEIIKGDNYTLTGLEDKFGISRWILTHHYGAKSKGRGRPGKSKPFSKPEKPKPSTAPLAADPATPKISEFRPRLEPTRQPEPVRRSLVPFFIGMFLIGFGIAGAVDGAFINWRYSYSFGGNDPYVSFACGVIGLVVDAGATFFLPAVGILARRWSLWALVALVAWVPFLLGSVYASLGFVGVNLGDAIQARKAPSTQREILTAQLDRTVKLRNAITEMGDQRMLENQMNLALGRVPRRNRDSSDECKNPTQYFSAGICLEFNILHDRWVSAKSRDDDDGMIAALSAQIKALPPIGSANPSAEQLEQMSGGKISQEQASNYQVRWLAVVPGSSSVLLTIGLVLVIL